MKGKADLRVDAITARHIAQALKTQAEYGYEKARYELEALGVDIQLAVALLARRYDRRDTFHHDHKPHPGQRE